MPIEAIVPLAPDEPAFIVEEAVDHMTSSGLDPLFVADVPSDGVVEAIEGGGGRVLARQDTRGRRAGAINDGLERVESEYVAILDVDTRVSREFLEAAVERLEGDGSVFLASGPREVTNESAGPTPLAVSAEYRLIGDLYRLAERTGGFLQFNGLIGVARRSVLDMGLNESVSCEDVEFATRAYAEGYRACLVDEPAGEQAPPTLGDLYSQRVRWLSGALETLSGHWRRALRSDASPGVKASWIVQMSAPLLLLALAPLMLASPLYGVRLRRAGEDRVLAKAALMPLLGLLLSWCSVVALARTASGRSPEWSVAERT